MNDTFAPITSQAGFFHAGLREVAGGLAEWRRGLKDWVELTELREPFPGLLRRLEPLALVGVCRELLLATDSGWTAYFNNAWRGTDAGGPAYVLSRRLGWRSVEMTSEALAVECAKRLLGTPA
jgi:hypothetical protein